VEIRANRVRAQGHDSASITTFAVHTRDINATALPTDDKAMGLTSIARDSYLFELKRWF
jgi:anionic cell wall polymer biosynthesis LytR-Cps2A-Psr (LCP) family protein